MRSLITRPLKKTAAPWYKSEWDINLPWRREQEFVTSSQSSGGFAPKFTLPGFWTLWSKRTSTQEFKVVLDSLNPWEARPQRFWQIKFPGKVHSQKLQGNKTLWVRISKTTDSSIKYTRLEKWIITIYNRENKLFLNKCLKLRARNKKL